MSDKSEDSHSIRHSFENYYYIFLNFRKLTQTFPVIMKTFIVSPQEDQGRELDKHKLNMSFNNGKYTQEMGLNGSVIMKRSAL